MQKIVLALGLFALIAIICQTRSQEVNGINFQEFKTRFNKQYSQIEDQYRSNVYAENIAFINSYNAAKGQKVFGITRFFDLTDEEFAAKYLYPRDKSDEEGITPQVNITADSIDWVAKGFVTQVRDQGDCLSQWAFSAVGTLEGFFKRNTGTLPVLSPKQLLDCSRIYELDHGCNGGTPSKGMNYVKKHGITTWAAYPYTAIQEKCSIKTGAYQIDGHTAIKNTEDALIAALQSYPVSVGVDATNWKYYDPATEKIFSDCLNKKLNHDVVAVGFTAEYWKVKNSWGTQWGDSGYIYLARGNTCGVLDQAVIPK